MKITILFVCLFSPLICISQFDSCFVAAKKASHLSIEVSQHGIHQLERHRIEMKRNHKNWYGVSYQSSGGRIAHRTIHRHRIQKFLKRFEKISHYPTTLEPQRIDCGLKFENCDVHFSVAKEHNTKVFRYLKILKIWPKPIEQK